MSVVLYGAAFFFFLILRVQNEIKPSRTECNRCIVVTATIENTLVLGFPAREQIFTGIFLSTLSTAAFNGTRRKK